MTDTSNTASSAAQGFDPQSFDPHDVIRSGYGAAARSGLSSDNEGVARIAQAFGYSVEELRSIPAEANMGLSCGNPVALASLKPGETVVDLGSGGGIDVFLAAQKVGAEGRVIGVDMTGDMIALARRNAAKAGVANVEFRLGEIEAMPIADARVDCVDLQLRAQSGGRQAEGLRGNLPHPEARRTAGRERHRPEEAPPRGRPRRRRRLGELRVRRDFG